MELRVRYVYDSSIMLTLYLRHLKRCSKTEDRYWKRCSCPMWMEGTVNGSYIRRSLQTASWERAQNLAHQIEAADDPKAAPTKKEQPVTIQQAVNEYLADAKARDLAESTLSKLETIFRKQFLAWTRAEGYSLLSELDLRAVQSYRATWEDGGLATQDLQIAKLVKILKDRERLGQIQVRFKALDSAFAPIAPRNAEPSGDRRFECFRPHGSTTLVDSSLLIPAKLI